ncbi:MAG: patatin [Clostridia bacterium]|nr:patatin [Clostridia bacterium]
MVSILSIDGGGIRGIIPATFLAEFEKRTGKPVCDLFDLIAGTSTGGILSAMLTIPNSFGQPKYSAAQIRSAYFEHGGAIFHKSLLRSVATLGGLARPIYSPRTLERMLAQYLGGTRLHETLTEILVTAYDMASSTPWFFKTSFAKTHHGPIDDPLLTQVVRATTAAPTYFPPLSLEGHCLVDGGVFASNPALCAYAQARNMYPLEREFFVVSLGTGLQEHNRPCAKIDNWGIIDWAVPISALMLNASSATVNYQMRALIGGANYSRFQLKLDPDATGMDDASDKNMRKLDVLAREAVWQQFASIDRICRILKERKGSASSLRVSAPAHRGDAI